MSTEAEALMIDISGRIPAQPPGWVYDGIRKINNYEYHFDGVDWVLWLGSEQSTGIYPAAVKAKTWRPATEEDIGREDARFWDANSFAWSTGELIYVFEGSVFPFAIVPDKKPVHVKRAAQCEVPVLPDEKESNATQDPQRRRVSRDDEPETVTVRKRRKSNTRKGSPKKS